MIKYYFTCLSFILLNLVCFGSELNFDKCLTRIDSLGTWGKFDEAQFVLDSFLQMDKSEPLDPEKQQELLQLKAFYLSENNQEREALSLILKVIKNAQVLGLYRVEYLSHITASLIQEKAANQTACKEHLNAAKQLYSNHDLTADYGFFCIRAASFFRVFGQEDSALYYAKRALEYSEKYDNEVQSCNANLLMGIILTDSFPIESIEHYIKAKEHYLKFKRFDAASYMYGNISSVYRKTANLEQALLYSDSCLLLMERENIPLYSGIFFNRAKIFKALGNIDSSFFYYELYHEYFAKEIESNNQIELKKITEKFQHEKDVEALKNQAKINEKQSTFLFVSMLLLAISIIMGVVIYVSKQQLSIKSGQLQIKERVLQKTLKQKEILLSELQHRVKNNLQLIIALLDFQKEKINSKNGLELIEESQLRVQSLAFLQDKIYIKNQLNEDDLKLYLKEIIKLAQQAFNRPEIVIDLVIEMEFTNLDISKATNLGLILLEFINNSYKHAFKSQNSGLIKIELLEKKELNFTCILNYQDNGIGCKTTNLKSNGMGFEIIEGLVHQMKGNMAINSENGFNCKILFNI